MQAILEALDPASDRSGSTGTSKFIDEIVPLMESRRPSRASGPGISMSYIYECPQCGREISRTARVCGHCGYRGTSLFSIVLAATIALLGIAAIINSNRPNVQAPVPIANASQTPDTNKPSTKSRIETARQLRKSFAHQFDRKMFEARIESTTRTYGPEDTALLITDSLAGQVRARKIVNALDFELLNKLGFKKVVYTNGFEGEIGTTFTWGIP
jgi:ribosomal protein L32